MERHDLQVPPSNQDAEQAVLGAVLLDNRCLGKATGAGLSAEDFYNENHASIFAAMVDMEKCGFPIDAITLTEKMGEVIDRVGGPSYLGILAAQAGKMANVDTYIGIVKEKSELRNFILLTQDLSARAFETSMNGAEFLDTAEREFFAFSEKRIPSRFASLEDVGGATVELIRKRFENPQAVIGIPTGYTELDFETAGLQPTDLNIIAARPSMGKTAFGFNIAMNAVQRDPRLLCAFFSLEMDRSMLGIRMLASETGIDARRLQRGDITREELAVVTEKAAALKTSGMYIDDSSFQTVASIAAKCRRLARVGMGSGVDVRKLGMVVVDYLTLVSCTSRSGGRSDERYDLAIGDITWGLKKLAKELKIPVVLLAQLNRQCEQRGDKRPMLSDLRDSGNIEQDADVILFIYRDVKYNRDTLEPNVAEIIIGKQRNGPTGIVKLKFDDACTRFSDYEHEDIRI